MYFSFFLLSWSPVKYCTNLYPIFIENLDHRACLTDVEYNLWWRRWIKSDNLWCFLNLIFLFSARVGSLASGSLFFWSMLSVKMCDITSVTFTCLCGSTISGLGLILTSFVREFKFLYLTHSLLFGLGTSLMYTPSLVVIARWFGKWRSIATGFVVASGSLGQVVLSPLLQLSMDSQGVRRTFRLWGIVFLSSTVFSALSFYLLEERCMSDPEKAKGSKYQIKWRLFKNKAYVIWVITMMITNFTYYIPLIHLVSIDVWLFLSTYLSQSYWNFILLVSLIPPRTLELNP